MNFLYGSFLVAIISIGIPIIIHFFQFRKFKRVNFSSIRFLDEIQKDKKNSNQLKHWLILLSRILLISCLVLAFAMPFLTDLMHKSFGKRNQVVLYIDNSFSMNAKSTKGTLLQEAKAQAESIIKAYKESDRFLVFSNSKELSSIRRWMSKSEVINIIASLKITPESKSLSNLIPPIDEAFAEDLNANNQLYLISDFQTNFLNNKGKITSPNSRFQSNIIKLKSSNQANVYIDSVWMDAPVLQVGQSNILNARIKNIGSSSLEGMTIGLKINNQQKGLATINLEAKSSKNIEIPFTIAEKGYNRVELCIQDYPITFDDQYFAGFEVPEQIPIVLIGDNASNKLLKQAFLLEKAFQVSDYSPSNVTQEVIKKATLIVLSGIDNLNSGITSAIIQANQQGTNVLFFPSTNSKISPDIQTLIQNLGGLTYGQMNIQKQKVGQLNQSSPFFNNIFDKIDNEVTLPTVNQFFSFNNNGKTTTTLMNLNNGGVFMSYNQNGNGYLFQFAVPLNESFSNLVLHPIFLPILYKSAFFSNNIAIHSYTIGVDNQINIPLKNLKNEGGIINDLTIKSDKSNTTLIPGKRIVSNTLNLNVGGLFKESGFYQLINGNKLMTYLPVNYDRTESNLIYADNTDILKYPLLTNAKIYKNNNSDVISAQIKDEAKGTFLWKYFLIGALLFLLTESFLIYKL